MCVTLHLDHATADALLTARGWTIVRGEDAHTHHPWRYFLRPGGKPREDGGQLGTDYVWHAHQALHDALDAEVATLTAATRERRIMTLADMPVGPAAYRARVLADHNARLGR
jgi:hypothetical protein